MFFCFQNSKRLTFCFSFVNARLTSSKTTLLPWQMSGGRSIQRQQKADLYDHCFSRRKQKVGQTWDRGEKNRCIKEKGRKSTVWKYWRYWSSHTTTRKATAKQINTLHLYIQCVYIYIYIYLSIFLPELCNYPKTRYVNIALHNDVFVCTSVKQKPAHKNADVAKKCLTSFSQSKH